MHRLAVSPQLLLILASLFWGANSVVGRAIAESIPPISISFWRWLIAFLVLLPFTGRALVRALPVIRQHWRLLFAYVVFGTAGCNAISYSAMHFTTAINVALINSTTPIYVMVLSFLLFRDRITGAQGLGLVLSLFGILAILSAGTLETFRTFSLNVGDLMMLVAMALWGSYTALLRKKPAGLEPLVFVTILVGLSAFVLLPLYLVERQVVGTFALTPGNLAAILYAGTLPAVVAMMFWNRGVAAIGANRASPYIHLMPVFTTLLATVFLGESFGWHHAVGITAILSGVWLASRKQAKA